MSRFVTKQEQPTPILEQANLNRLPLVAHGYKCDRCGSTVIHADPLPHRCGTAWPFGVSDYSRCSL